MEFALVLPLFLVIVLATVDFGWALRAYITLTNSAREGARVGVIATNVDATIRSTTISSSGGLMPDVDTSENYITISPTPSRTSGGSVTVGVHYTYHYITPFGSLLNLLTGSALAISTSTTMRVE